MAIQSFADGETERFFRTGRVTKMAGWASIRTVAKRKLDMLHYAFKLEDLRSPPGNRLESLSERLKGHYSVRINDRWRVVFQWSANGPSRVRIADYH